MFLFQLKISVSHMYLCNNLLILQMDNTLLPVNKETT